MEIIRILCAISILALLVPAENITINTNGNPQCGEDTGDTPRNCTLDAGLSAAQQFEGPVTITIQSGNYTLHNNTSCEYHNRAGIHILGQGSPVVNCLPGTGCSFYECQRIQVNDVTFIGCGAIHNSTSRNFSDTSYSLVLMKYQVALYFELCLDITMVNVNISNSNGTGLVFIDSVDRIRITDAWFVTNTVTRATAGGGGVYVEFSECKPGNVSCVNDTDSADVPSAHTSFSVYEFVSCHFINNSASSGGFKTTQSFNSETKSNHYVFGRGGGLLVYFKGNASNNSVSLSACEFAENQANLGAGLFTSFSDKSQSNSMTITATNFTHNECYKAKILSDNIISGGGIKVNFGSNANQNNFFIEGSFFINNTAAWAGGISVYAIGENHCKTLVRNSAKISGCYFESNIARLGAAIDLFSPSKLKESSFNPIIENCHFTSNGGLYDYINGSKRATCGTVYIKRMSVTFKGDTHFEKNVGSALVIQSSSEVHFSENTTSNFSANVGRIGAAITLLGTSWIRVNAGTHFLFDRNTAVEKGGAIYAGQTNDYYTAYSHRCFIRYSDPYLPPWKDRDVVWESSFTFLNNTSTALKEPNAIFASSILPCVWSSSPNSTLEDDISKTFCNWSNWKFKHSKCWDEVLTSAVNFNSSMYSMSVVPGWKEMLKVTVYDDYGEDVTNRTVFSLYFDNYHDEDGIKFQYTSDNSITVYGKEEESTVLAVETVSNRNGYTRINITLSVCPPGFLFNESCDICVCPNSSFANFVFCKEFKGIHQAFIYVGYCISYTDQKVIVSRCPFGVEEESIEPAVKLPRNVYELDAEICRKLGRTGKLCGECEDRQHGISVISGTFKCVKCDNFYNHLWRFFALNFLGPTVFFIIIIIFHIGVTSAPANGFIFFSQVITIPLKVLLIDSAWKLLFHTSIHSKVPHGYLTNILLHPYRLWSLDFNSLSNAAVCLSPHLKVIDVLAIRYVSAVYPVIVLIAAYAVIELHARNCRLMVCLWKPCCFLCVKLRRKWKAKNSIIDAFATFILLSYTKFIRVSITILSPSNVYNINGSVVEQTVNYDPTTEYFSNNHFPYAALAVVILATFGALPPLLLLLYPFRWFQRCLTRCRLQSHALRAFVDAFQGCYKDGRNGGPDRRYFAGIYFIFRIIIYTIYTVSNSFWAMFTQLQTAYVIFVLTIVILQPYRKCFYNLLDGFFFALLAVTSGLSMYMYTTLLNNKELSKNTFYLTYALYFIPNIYMVTYVVYWLLMRSRWFKTHCLDSLKNRFQQHYEEDTISSQPLLEEEASVCTHTTSEVPDRLDNPDRYGNTSDGNNYFEGSWVSEQTTQREEMDPVTNYVSAVTY